MKGHMNKSAHQALRTCIACRSKGDASNLLRWTVSELSQGSAEPANESGGEPQRTPTQAQIPPALNLNVHPGLGGPLRVGRGAWTCASIDCVRKARPRLPRALRKAAQPPDEAWVLALAQGAIKISDSQRAAGDSRDSGQDEV